LANLLVLDSGVGGLSVIQEILRTLPSSSIRYFADHAAAPYGEKDDEWLIQRVCKVVESQLTGYTPDAIVVACNTASTLCLPHLRAMTHIPVVGVVPAIKPASNMANKAVGLIATPATVTREYTHDLIRSFSQSKPVEMLGSTRLVDMAEEKLRGKAICLDELTNILEPLRHHIDVAVLGCTHFPLIKEEIQSVLGQSVLLVDSGEAIARRVEALLGVNKQEKCGERSIFSTAPPWEEGALNRALNQLQFSSVQHYPLKI